MSFSASPRYDEDILPWLANLMFAIRTQAVMFIFVFSSKHKVVVGQIVNKANWQGKQFQFIIISLAVLFGLLVLPGFSFAQNSAKEKAEQMYQRCMTLLTSNNLDTLFIESNSLLIFSQNESLPYYQGQANYLLGQYYLSAGNPDSTRYYITHYHEYRQKGV